MGAQGELFGGVSFGAQCVRRMKEARAINGGKLEWPEVERIIEEELERATSLARKPKAARPELDELFDALLRCCGWQYSSCTRTQCKIAGVALASMREATPNLTRQELEARCAKFRRLYPGVPLTPNGLVKQWAALAPAPAALNSAASVYDEPEGWRTAITEHGLPNCSADAIENLVKRPWAQIAVLFGADIKRRLAQLKGAT